MSRFEHESFKARPYICFGPHSNPLEAIRHDQSKFKNPCMSEETGRVSRGDGGDKKRILPGRSKTKIYQHHPAPDSTTGLLHGG